MKRLTAAGLAAIATVALGGCVVFKAPPTAQQEGLFVRSTFTICGSEVSQTVNRPGCEDGGNGDESDPGYFEDVTQLFMAFRVPDGTGVPQSFSDTQNRVSLVRSPSYTAQLQEDDQTTPPPGFHWEGYVSGPVAPDSAPDGSPAREATFSVRFALPGSSDGTVDAGSFAYRPVVGGRNLTSGETPPLPGDPVDCGDDPFSVRATQDAELSICIDSPSEATTAENLIVPIARVVPPPPPPVADTVKPVVSSLGVSPRAFLAANRGGAIAARGTTVSYSLSEAASVRFTVRRAAKGRRVRGKCVKPRRGNRGARRCTRFVKVRGAFVHQGAAGSNSFRFTGRLRGRKLKAGRYRLIGVATDAAGNRSEALRTGFRIKKPPRRK